jgi:hypothetical protein
MENSKPEPVKKSSINKRSKKKVAEDQEYSVLRKDYLEKHPLCEIAFAGCTNHATEIHHTKGRGINYLNVSTWKAGCRNCHHKAHSNPDLARESDLL